MILLLGATGFIGQAFARELQRRGECFIPLSRRALDYTQFDLLFEYVRRVNPTFLINAAGIWGRPNLRDVEAARMETFQLNALLPQTIAKVCLMTNTPWGHVSSSSIYTGAKVFHNGEIRIERDLSHPAIRRLFQSQADVFLGFNELDDPNFTFRNPPCDFVSGTKALAEECLRKEGTFIWRAGTLFDESAQPGNLLFRLQSEVPVSDRIATLSHLQDYVRSCLDLIERRATFGIYNIANPGVVMIREVLEMIRARQGSVRRFGFYPGSKRVFARRRRSPESSCILDVSKLLNTGLKIRHVDQALKHALDHWTPASVEPDIESDDLPMDVESPGNGARKERGHDTADGNGLGAFCY